MTKLFEYLDVLLSIFRELKIFHDIMHARNPIVIRGVELTLAGSIGSLAAYFIGLGHESGFILGGLLYLAQEKLIKHRDNEGELLAKRYLK